MPHRHWRLLLACAVIAMTLPASGCSPEYRAGALPYLTAVTPHSIVVSWFAASDEMNGVSFWPDGFPEQKTTLLTPRPAPPWKHVSVTIEGLSPSTRYDYVVFSRTGSGEFRSPEYSFSTAPDDVNKPFSFLVYADTQNHIRHHEVVAQMMKSPGAALLLHCGDIVNIPITQQWGSFFEAAAPVLSCTPFYPVYGNHDMHNPEFGLLFAPARLKPWYSFDYGSVHFIAIDSTSDYGPASEQYQWLEKDLKASLSRPWRVAFFHHPPYSPTRRDNTPAARQYLEPLLARYGVRLVFNSHSHMYYPYDEGSIRHVITGGGGGWAITREPSQYDAPFHFVRVDVTLDALTVTGIRADGSMVDSFVLGKPGTRSILIRPLSAGSNG